MNLNMKENAKNGNNGPETSTGMLRELGRSTDSARWTEFATLYTPLFKIWLAGIHRAHPALPEYLDDDIIQETLVAMMKLFPDLKYDRRRGAFRGFLHGVLRNKVLGAMERYRLTAGGKVIFSTDYLENGANDIPDRSGEAGDPVSERIEILREIWSMLVRRVFAEGKYSKQTQTIFLLSVSGEHTIADIAKMYNETPNNIYQIRNRILNAVRKKRQQIDKGSEDLLDLLEKLSSEEPEK